jgi:hypothetical protein
MDEKQRCRSLSAMYATMAVSPIRPNGPLSKGATELGVKRAIAAVEVPKLAAAMVADIAGIPRERREAFCVEAADLISRAHSRALDQAFARASRTTEKKFEEIEAAVSALRGALRKLTREEFGYFRIKLRSAYHELAAGESTPIGDLLPFLEVDGIARALSETPVTTRALRALALASANMTNKNPNRRGRRGNWQNAAFQVFVGGLWRCAHKHGGALSANCKNNVGSGAMFKALDELRPHFAKMYCSEGFIKNVLPAQTIANIVAANRKKRTAGKST